MNFQKYEFLFTVIKILVWEHVQIDRKPYHLVGGPKIIVDTLVSVKVKKWSKCIKHIL